MSIVRLVSTGTSTGSYPIYCAVNCLFSAFLSNENSPFTSVTVPIFVPLYITLAPISGSPFGSVTFPLIISLVGITAILAILIFLADSGSEAPVVIITSSSVAATV